MVGGKVEVDDSPDILHMYPSRNNVGCDQRLDLSGGEVLQRPSPLTLASFAMDRGGPDPIAVKLANYPVTAVTGPGEDDRRSRGINRLGGDLEPIRSGDGPEHMVSSDNVGCCRAYSMARRIVLVVADQRLDRTIKRGGEQHRLPSARSLVE